MDTMPGETHVHPHNGGLTMRLDDLIFWFCMALTVALFASLQYDPCNQYTDGTEIFLECETGEPMNGG